MRISDWSSDVCSSDLRRALPAWIVECLEDRPGFINETQRKRDVVWQQPCDGTVNPSVRSGEPKRHFDVGARGSHLLRRNRTTFGMARLALYGRQSCQTRTSCRSRGTSTRCLFHARASWKE